MDYMNKYKVVAEQFCVDGDVIDIVPYGEGHINVTLLVTTTAKRYILQRMNTYVFTNPYELMSNICNVTAHLKAKGQETLTVIKTKDGKDFMYGEECFRMYDFIENTITYQSVTDATVFYNAGKAFGEFQNTLADFDASKLYETIKAFHNTPKRFNDFKNALAENKSGRAENCAPEIDFVLSRENTYGKIIDGLNDGSIPLRVTHNDTKLNNIMLDDKNNKVRAIIDLDTVMPGSMLYDFGDSIRFGASTAKEDEKNLDIVHFDIDLFKAYAEGFCLAMKKVMTETEKKLLPYSAYLMTIECGMRFLADYITGDVYFAVKYPEHNLDRARTQIKLASEMESRFDEMSDIVNKIFM